MRIGIIGAGNMGTALAALLARSGREAGQPESEWVQAQLHHPVIKAFNTIRPQSLTSLGRAPGSARN
jgi:predicted dinucleotide-binding enzyme